MHIHGLHHLHKRHLYKRKTSETVDSPFIRLLDIVALINGIAGSFAAVPQIYQILNTGQSVGVSLPTWELLAVSSIIWLIYGMAHKTWPIICSSGLSIIFSTGVIIAVITH
ncbi:MAG TPA: PQ-loop domain-containing transporter [Candidatus Paceibacterota bacterium]